MTLAKRQVDAGDAVEAMQVDIDKAAVILH